ncbi:MAG TPA: hypothetical protein VFC07_03285, partial [Verrucomicrobiae bacterium]|nr:hypothetical protein [Verrucomicrobiae bacterium]
MRPKIPLCLNVIVCCLLGGVNPAMAQGTTAFTYQGQLNVAGSPANGSYDLRFGLFPSPSSGAPVGGFITNNGVTVVNGLFTTALDFGNVFNGAPWWLDISVRTNGSANGFTSLSPRQSVTAAPYALMAGNVTGVLAATNLPANVALLNGSANFTGTVTAGSFSGNGAGLTNLNAINPTGNGAG